MSDLKKTLRAAGLESLETLTLEAGEQVGQLKRGIAPVEIPFIILREIPDDNSCLFNAIGYVLEDKSLYKAQDLRDSNRIFHNCFVTVFLVVVAAYILARPLEYPAAVLGQAPSDYAQWIRQPDKWGGAIELAIFSDIYGVEIASFDVQTGRMDLFGEGRKFSNRVYLQYTGIHYEAFALAKSASAPHSQDQTIFPSTDVLVMEQVRELVLAARAAHRYTDTSKFTLKCTECGKGFQGQGEAQKHATSSGHFNFVEYQ